MTEVLEETDFDYIVLGTGLIESILAGSLARSGRKVLHLDSRQNYGGNWSAFGFRELINWYLLNESGIENSSDESDTSIGYERNYKANFRNVQLELHGEDMPSIEKEAIEEAIKEGKSIEEYFDIPENTSDKALFEQFYKDSPKADFSIIGKTSVFTQLMGRSRSYNFDSTPKLLGTREELVEILIRSGVGRYLEFKNVDDIYMYDNTLKALEKVPSSKEDVFTNKTVSLIEKRKLMKYLTFAMEFNREDPLLEGTENMTFTEFLQNKFKITGKLLDAIIYAIAIVDKTVSVNVGLNQTHTFVTSMGRFGKGAYLCPLYGGASEIAQAFCRVCAVYGGVYILNQPLDRYIIENSECTGVVTKEGTEYRCKKLIAGIDYLNTSWLPEQGDFGKWIARAMILSKYELNDIELKEYFADNLSYSVYPPGSDASNEKFPIYGILQNDETMACPKGEFVTYLWTTDDIGCLKEAIKLLSENQSDESKTSQIRMSVCYQQRSRSAKDYENFWKLPKNIIPCSDPDATINFKSCLKEARELFYKCESADVEFMPSAEQEEEEDF